MGRVESVFKDYINKPNGFEEWMTDRNSDYLFKEKIDPTSYTSSTDFSNMLNPDYKLQSRDVSHHNDWLGRDGYLATGANILSAGSGVLQAYTGFKSLAQAKEQFEFEKSLANRNLQAQGKQYNASLAERERLGRRLSGREYGTDELAERQRILKESQVNTSRI